MSDIQFAELFDRFNRNRAIDKALGDRLERAERRRDKRSERACFTRWHRLSADDDEIARLCVAEHAEDLEGIAYKLALWRIECAYCGFDERRDLFAFGAYRDAIRIVGLPKHAKDRRELLQARRWSCGGSYAG